MERLQRLSGVIALLLLGIVLVSLYRAFESAIAQPIALVLGILMGALLTVLLLRVALVPETATAGRASGWVRGVTGRNGRYAFLVLLLGWGAGMVAIKFLPRQNEGGLALIGMLLGFFLFMGFIWSVISE